MPNDLMTRHLLTLIVWAAFLTVLITMCIAIVATGSVFAGSPFLIVMIIIAPVLKMTMRWHSAEEDKGYLLRSRRDDTGDAEVGLVKQLVRAVVVELRRPRPPTVR